MTMPRGCSVNTMSGAGIFAIGADAMQTFENPKPNYHGDRLIPAGKLDLDSGFGLVDDGREVTTSSVME